MLISHVRKFIYLKTYKTAGTSVEIYFEPWCIEPGINTPDRHFREAEESQWGVVGTRGFPKGTWYHHMPAEQIRDLVGQELWDQYFKFCVVRNPFDMLVSHFWYNVASPVRELLKHADFSVVRRTFAEWIRLAELPLNRTIYTIGDKAVPDYFIRFENLSADLEQVCHRLNIPWKPERLGRYKSEYRIRPEHFIEYYTPEAAALVEQQFAWELQRFGYSAGSDLNAR
jgi:hypothetical protein